MNCTGHCESVKKTAESAEASGAAAACLPEAFNFLIFSV